MKRGFTLPELLVVIFIIGILAAIVFPLWGDIQERKNKSKAFGDLKNIEAAIARLAADTSRYPDGDADKPFSVCNVNAHTTLMAGEAGLLSTDGNFPNWRGPYISATLRDPWGNPYLLRSTYRCRRSVLGCDNVQEPRGRSVVILSRGKDGNVGSPDDIVVVLCRRP